jgi:hypothetical protein
MMQVNVIPQLLLGFAFSHSGLIEKDAQAWVVWCIARLLLQRVDRVDCIDYFAAKPLSFFAGGGGHFGYS